MTVDWQPTATIALLKQRAEILAMIRTFFAARQVIEVETPLLCRATVTDLFLHSLEVNYADSKWFLQTSPEYAMKRLLAAGMSSIYQITKAFRRDESGRLHNPEFTMLEWYRTGYNHHDLMDEMDALLQMILNSNAAQRFTYAELFELHFTIDPHTVLLEQLQQIAQHHQLTIVADNLDCDDWLQLLMSHIIEPTLGKHAPTFVYDFPTSQAALAKIRYDAIPVAERFEVYIQGVELANGYHELADASEQAKRFQADLQKRQLLGYEQVPIDHHLLAALEHGFPDCAGVALGIDRLIMIATKQNQLADVVAFPIERV